MTPKRSAILTISPGAYREIRTRLVASDRAATIKTDPIGEIIDIEGLALRAEPRPGVTDENTRIEIASILSRRTKTGMVEVTVNETNTQLDLDKAREVHAMLAGAIEAAVSDTLIYKFLTERVGLSDEQASAALLEFRELRQGSKGTVYPT